MPPIIWTVHYRGRTNRNEYEAIKLRMPDRVYWFSHTGIEHTATIYLFVIRGSYADDGRPALPEEVYFIGAASQRDATRHVEAIRDARAAGTR